jgi:selenocysteine lyase/cysteine desulfurase
VDWNVDDSRHEAGSPNVIGAYAIASACRALTEAGFEQLAAREQALLGRLTAALGELPRVRVLSLFGENAHRVGVLSFVVDSPDGSAGADSAAFAAALSDRYGIGVRDGLFCAHPLVRLLTGTDDGDSAECGAGPLNAVRVSFGAGTPEEHVDRFITAVRELTA